VDPQVSYPRRHVLLDNSAERLTARLAVPLVIAETIGLSVLFVAYTVLDRINTDLASLLIPPVVTLMVLVAMPRAISSRPLRVLVSYTIAAGAGLLLTDWLGHSLAVTILVGAVTLLGMHMTGTLHPPAVATALVASRLNLDETWDVLALPFVLAVIVAVIMWAWLGHRLLGDPRYPTGWW